MTHHTTALFLAIGIATGSAQLKLDFQPVGGTTASGFEAFEATNQADPPTITNTYTAFGTEVEITIDTANLPDGNLDFRAVTRTGTDGATNPNLDWIGVDTRASGVDVTMTMTVSGLPAGDYNWLSGHHDGGNGNIEGLADYTFTDAGGTETVPDGINISRQLDDDEPPATFSRDFTSDGLGDIVVSFVMDNGQADVGAGDINAIFVFINSLVISQAADLDDDGLPDAYEQTIIDADPDDAIESIEDVLPGDDFDDDGLDNSEEFALGTVPTDPDSDDDGLLDGVEDDSGSWTDSSSTGTDPLHSDSDRDGLLDGVENPDLPHDPNAPATQPGTDPNIADSDGDLRPDGIEVNVHGTDPSDPESFFDPSRGAIALFDFQPIGASTQEGWTAADEGNGSDGAIDVTTEVIGAVTVDIRDRVGGDFEAGADPAHAAMWNDFVFANGSFDSAPGTGLRITLSGLRGSATYPITIWAYDDASNNGRDADWGQAGLPTAATLMFPSSPDPSSLAEYTITFEVVTNAAGVAVIDGIVAATNPDVSHNVFVNGLAVGPPVGGTSPFQITGVELDRGAGTLTVTWPSIPGRFYALEYSTSLEADSWSEIDDGIPSGGDSTTYVVSGEPDITAEQQVFVRVFEP